MKQNGIAFDNIFWIIREIGRVMNIIMVDLRSSYAFGEAEILHWIPSLTAEGSFCLVPSDVVGWGII